MNLFQQALKRQNVGRPPVWFMRQAGRYHSHYQELRKHNSFMDICKKPEVACEATMGPIRDFDFDAAILFSDLLFPLEVMGTGLTYENGPPELFHHLETLDDVRKLRSGAGLAQEMSYQGEAMRLIRRELPHSKGLLGFVGGPLTLFSYAVEGSHQGGLPDTHTAMRDGRFAAFTDKLLPMLAENMALQARGGADAIAVLDTCAGEFSVEDYRTHAVPAIRSLLKRFKELCPETSVVYYSKKTKAPHWDTLLDIREIDGIGVDWNVDLADTLDRYSDRWAIQGNVDPHWLFLEPAELERRLREVFARVKALPPAKRYGWICGLGHGVLPKTPESNVKLYIRLQREIFA